MTEQELHEVFSKNIKEFRGNFDWSQVALAKKAGVSINFVNDIESGKKWASPATMIKLANALDVQVYELLRPSGLLPDNLNSIFKKYTEDVYTAVEGIRFTFSRDSKPQ